MLIKIKRGFMLLAVWSLAIYGCCMAFDAWRENNERRSELAASRLTYDNQLQSYSRLLAEGDALREDRQYQRDLLKRSFGYTEPDETPIVIVRDNPDSDVSSTSE